MSVTTRSQRVTATLMLIAACAAFGAVIGYMGTALLSADSASTWTSFADRPGALVLGGVLGGLAGAYLARDLSVTARWWSTAIAVALAAGSLWSLALAT